MEKMTFHPRRAASWILGFWFGTSLFMIVVAMQNFRMADTLIANPSAGMRERFGQIGEPEVRLLLRHQASELNQLYFPAFEVAGIALAVAFAALAFTGLRAIRMMKPVAVMLLILIAAEHFILTPEIGRLGRLADFQVLESGTPEHHRFWTYHAAYSTVEVVKIALLALVSLRLLWGNPRKSD